MATRHQRLKFKSNPGLRRRFRPLLESVERRQLLAVIVTSAADSGESTLREAIDRVNAGLVDDDTIQFNIQENSGFGPVTIFLNSDLPVLTHPVHIQGLSQPGATPNDQFDTDNANLQIILNGQKQGLRGLVFGGGSDGSDVSGLVFQGFTQTVIEIAANSIHVFGNYIGVAQGGFLSSNTTNESNGIAILQGSSNTIGGSTLAERNLITSNGGNGILIHADSNSIAGNFIGVDASGGFAPVVEGATLPGNRENGIEIQFSTSNSVGGLTRFDRNIVSGNGMSGIVLGGFNNAVLSGFTGLTTTGLPLGNLRNGIAVTGSGNSIGIPGNTERNVISGNNVAGVVVGTPLGPSTGPSDTAFSGNYIGLDPSGVSARPNLGSGVIDNGIDSTYGSGNVISGNTNLGIFFFFDNDNSTITGSTIGLNILGDAAPNQGGGIRATGDGLTIGSTDRSGWNVISGNGQNGIIVGFPTSPPAPTTILGNLIGLDPSGMIAHPNEWSGVQNDGGTSMIVDGAYISGNGRQGIQSSGSATIRNSVIGLGLDGATPIGNGESGIYLPGSRTTVITDNVISGNVGNGILAGRFIEPLAIHNNTIGLDITGTVAVGNQSNGITFIDTRTANVGGIGGGNVISGNGGSGIYITNNPSLEFPFVSGSIVANTIGLNSTGTAVIPNRAFGVYVTDVSRVTIGGTNPQDRNVISGNIGDGIRLESLREPSGLPAGPILGNVIGLDPTGRISFGNGGNGIAIANVNSFTIGGSGGGGNQISGNGGKGIFIETRASGPPISGGKVIANTIGLNIDGTAAIGNGSHGIFVLDASRVTVGGTGAGEGNVLSGNTGDGVHFEGSEVFQGITGSLVLGNTIGLDPTGRTTYGNGQNGVSIVDGLSSTIGGTGLGRNVISGNGANGIIFLSRRSEDLNTFQVEGATEVLGNVVGLDLQGNAAGNGNDGLSIQGLGSVIVGSATDPLAGNVFSANGRNGIAIVGMDSSAMRVLGNSIGVGLDGLADRGNGLDGILISDAADNTIGGEGGAGNVLSFNRQNGVQIIGGSASRNVLIGNAIGVDRGGNRAQGNGNDGVFINNASGNSIGIVGAAGTINVISGNGEVGVEIAGQGASGNSVVNNFIGLGRDGFTSLANGADGIFVDNAPGNTIGAPAAPNVISNPAPISLVRAVTVGIQLFGPGATGNVIQSNRIGTDATGTADRGSTVGVFINNAPNNTVGGSSAELGNLISGNDDANVQIVGRQASGNQIINNTIGLALGGTARLNEQTIRNLATFINDPERISDPRTLVGLQIDQAPGTFVQANVVSDNRIGVGITGVGANSVLVSNRIGVQATGDLVGPNGPLSRTGNDTGVFVNNSSGNFIGAPGLGNEIRFNQGVGLYFFGPASAGNLVRSNRIGQNQDGVYFEGARDNLIGGDSTTDGNEIVGNRSTGVYFFSRATTGNAVRSNRITDSGQFGALYFNTRLNNRAPQNGPGANLFARNAVANVRIFNGRATPASVLTPTTRAALANRPAKILSTRSGRPTA